MKCILIQLRHPKIFERQESTTLKHINYSTRFLVDENVFSSKLIDLKSEKIYNNAIIIVLPDF